MYIATVKYIFLNNLQNLNLLAIKIAWEQKLNKNRQSGYRSCITWLYSQHDRSFIIFPIYQHLEQVNEIMYIWLIHKFETINTLLYPCFGFVEHNILNFIYLFLLNLLEILAWQAYRLNYLTSIFSRL